MSRSPTLLPTFISHEDSLLLNLRVVILIRIKIFHPRSDLKWFFSSPLSNRLSKLHKLLVLG